MSKMNTTSESEAATAFPRKQDFRSDITRGPRGRPRASAAEGTAAGGNTVVDWGRVLSEGGDTPRGLSDAAVINNWLAGSDEGAFTGIVTQVGTSSADELDRLDAALLSLATTNGSPDIRVRLIKFYALFKVAEMQRYRKFRGFPQ
jgi:hypothetical protein